MSLSRRNQLLTDEVVQGELLFRAIIYWFFCLMVVAILVVGWSMVTGPPRPLSVIIQDSLVQTAPSFFGSIALLPIVLMDVLKVSSRFVGPIQRLRNVLRKAAAGEPTPPLVVRKDDFAIMCTFFNGVAKPIDSAFGNETCGWVDDRLISVQDFMDGLRVVNQFDTSEDRQELRVITTASSDTAPMPFTITHYYRRFERVPGRFECIETLSRKRVCGIGALTP